jgi:hypothetical protein
MNIVMITRTQIINEIMKTSNAMCYLEIGVSNGNNFNSINAFHKISVDPDPNSTANLIKTSDEFFRDNEDTFDVIFIDGLHTEEQVTKDIRNSLEILSENGFIICHDTNPIEKQHQTEQFNGSLWNGTCWRSIVRLKQEREDLKIMTIDEDHGCTIITRSNEKQKLLSKELELTYENLEKNRVEWLNLVSYDVFVSFLNSLDSSILLGDYIENPENPETNRVLANYYDLIGQTASAVSFFLRTVERTDNKNLQYDCLLRAADCFSRQGTRSFTVKGILQHAIATLPKRPEAYYFLSKMYSEQDDTNAGKWFDAYTTASIALDVCENFEPSNEFFLRPTSYPGKYALLFQKAHSSWWCGLCEESRSIFLDLYENYEMEDSFKTATINNLKFMNCLPPEENEKQPFHTYSSGKHKSLKYKFPGSEKIERNYSEAYQDMFVLSALNGKRNGTYLEIGAGNTFYGNNTALLETEFGWSGVSVDFNESFVRAHHKERKNPCVLRDATTIDYSKFLKSHGFDTSIDYLQIDCDPPEVSLRILQNIPFEEYRFATITFEHDFYTNENDEVRSKSRKLLESYGYKLIVGNVSPRKNKPYEDWWIHPELVNIFNLEVNKDKQFVIARDYFLK